MLEMLPACWEHEKYQASWGGGKWDRVRDRKCTSKCSVISAGWRYKQGANGDGSYTEESTFESDGLDFFLLPLWIHPHTSPFYSLPRPPGS